MNSVPSAMLRSPLGLRLQELESLALVSDQVRSLWEGYVTVAATYESLMSACLTFSTEHARTREYIRYGFLRRLGTLQRCIQNVYSTYPPERADIPSRHETIDLTINLQSFIFNVFGCIDNLAWVWAIERQLTSEMGGPLRPIDISFQKTRLRQTLSQEFQKYLTSRKDWFKYLESFRHALAHRIPLYIPPYTVSTANNDKFNELEALKNVAIERRDFQEYDRLNAEQTKLGTFTPAMIHSHGESPFVFFHPQILADWNTVAEITDAFLKEVKKAPPLPAGQVISRETS